MEIYSAEEYDQSPDIVDDNELISSSNLKSKFVICDIAVKSKVLFACVIVM